MSKATSMWRQVESCSVKTCGTPCLGVDWIDSQVPRPTCVWKWVGRSNSKKSGGILSRCGVVCLADLLSNRKWLSVVNTVLLYIALEWWYQNIHCSVQPSTLHRIGGDHQGDFPSWDKPAARAHQTVYTSSGPPLNVRPCSY